MDCYIISTLNNLDLMHLNKGNRYFVLAHFYLQYEHYRNFFKKVKQNGGFITLDNSAAERKLVSENDLLNIVQDLNPDEVIAPDILFDKERTIKHTQNFIDKMIEKDYYKKTSIFGCPQGKTEKEWLDCYEWMLNNKHIKTIGMSKISIPKCFGNGNGNDDEIAETRKKVYDIIVQRGLLKKELHFLGMGDVTEFYYYDKNNKFLRSTDSCYTILSAFNGIDFKDGNFKRIKTTNDFYEKKLNENQIKLAISNIDCLKSVLNDKQIKRRKNGV